MYPKYVKDFDYFIKNNHEVVSFLESKIKNLEWNKFTCSNSELDEIDIKIADIRKAIEFNKRLVS